MINMEEKIKVVSQSDSTLVVHVPDVPLSKTWMRRDQAYLIPRGIMIQAYYDYGVETLFKEGLLTTDDKDFLKEVGLMTEEDEPLVVTLSASLLARMISIMPLPELQNTLKTLSHSQLDDLADYAVTHYPQLNMDRIDILSKATRRNLLKQIENYKQAQED